MKCRCCNSENVVGVEYDYGHPHRYDGMSEIRCLDCKVRVGRWTGKVLAKGETEPPHGGRAPVRVPSDWEVTE